MGARRVFAWPWPSPVIPKNSMKVSFPIMPASAVSLLLAGSAHAAISGNNDDPDISQANKPASHDPGGKLFGRVGLKQN